MPLEAIGPEHIEAYVARKLAGSMGREAVVRQDVVNHLATLDVVWKVAKRLPS
jgi:hypothetical protein